jgi:hypothetical protein
MISSFLVSLVLFALARNGVEIGTAQGLIITIATTTVCWLATAYLGPRTDEATLVEFYRKVRPFGPGWAPVRAKAGAVAAEGSDNVPLALTGWLAGCVMIWSALFTVGNFLYGRYGYALGLLAVFVGSGLVLLRVVSRVWSDSTAYAARAADGRS